MEHVGRTHLKYNSILVKYAYLPHCIAMSRAISSFLSNPIVCAVDISAKQLMSKLGRSDRGLTGSLGISNRDPSAWGTVLARTGEQVVANPCLQQLLKHQNFLRCKEAKQCLFAKYSVYNIYTVSIYNII